MSRYDHLERALGAELLAKVHESRVLVVGAGGIGCELLKNLVLAGFRDIEVIDLDTIDVSNLNRQFLFRSRHVGMPKSTVARQAALEFNPDAKIKAHHGNVKAEEFGLKFFKSFDLVLNALDNVNARQHVNRLCLSAELPLIDSGTTGYLGQTMVIKKGETMCYDCDPKSDNKKSFPICTIRNTPDKPVHCIVWAKELFKLMFGRSDESMLSGTDESDAPPPAADSAAAGEGPDSDGNDAERKNAELKEKEMEVRSLIMSAVKRLEGDDCDDLDKLRAYARGVFEAVFDNEIKLKLKLRDGYKGAKKKPSPLSFETAQSQTETETETGGADTGAASASAPSRKTHALRDQRVLSLKECADLFVDTVLRMWAPERRSTIGDAVFDKDDEVSLDFVTAASNLRSHVFNIERKSKFDVKGIAGNIIHAIATTNAIVAGIQVIEAIKVLSRVKGAPLFSASLPGAPAGSEPEASVTRDCRAVWVVREPIGVGFLLQTSALGKPNPKCYSCGSATLNLFIDTTKATLGMVVEKVLRGRLGVNAPTVMYDSNEVYLEGDGLEEEEVEFFRCNLPKVLVDCPAGGIKDGAILDIEDYSQDMAFKVIIQHKDNDVFEEEGNADLFTVTGDAPVSKAEEPKQGAEDDAPAPGSDDVELVHAEQVDLTGAGKKRAREGVDGASSAKKARAEAPLDDGVIALDDD